MNITESVTRGAIQNAAKNPLDPVRIHPNDPGGRLKAMFSRSALQSLNSTAHRPRDIDNATPMTVICAANRVTKKASKRRLVAPYKAYVRVIRTTICSQKWGTSYVY